MLLQYCSHRKNNCYHLSSIRVSFHSFLVIHYKSPVLDVQAFPAPIRDSGRHPWLPKDPTIAFECNYLSINCKQVLNSWLHTEVPTKVSINSETGEEVKGMRVQPKLWISYCPHPVQKNPYQKGTPQQKDTFGRLDLAMIQQIQLKCWKQALELLWTWNT